MKRLDDRAGVGLAPHCDVGRDPMRRQRREERRGVRRDCRRGAGAEVRIGGVAPRERLIPEFGFRRQACTTDQDEGK